MHCVFFVVVFATTKMIVPLGLANLFCLVLGYLYPAYASFKALDEKVYDREQFRRWLVYWVVISAFSAVELLGDQFLFWFPFYYECKMAFIAWLVLPYFKGSATIYHKYIQPLLEKYYPHIDSHANMLKGHAMKLAARTRNASMTFVRSQSQGIIAGLAKSAAATTDDAGAGAGAAAAAATSAAATTAAAAAAPAAAPAAPLPGDAAPAPGVVGGAAPEVPAAQGSHEKVD